MTGVRYTSFQLDSVVSDEISEELVVGFVAQHRPVGDLLSSVCQLCSFQAFQFFFCVFANVSQDIFVDEDTWLNGREREIRQCFYNLILYLVLYL